MFRPSLGHPQALKENRSKITYMFYRNPLWDPKCSQSIPQLYPVLRSVSMLASHLCLGFATGLFPLGFLTIHSVPENPPIPLFNFITRDVFGEGFKS